MIRFSLSFSLFLFVGGLRAHSVDPVPRSIQEMTYASKAVDRLPQEKIKTPWAFSIIHKFKGSLDLGEYFKNWQEVRTLTYDNGYSMVSSVPPSYDGGYIAECLEVSSMPDTHESSVEQLVEVWQKKVQERSDKNIKFNILKKLPAEIIYSFVCVKDNLQVTEIVRTFLSESGCY